MDPANCLIVCPGGVGTYDELWDCVSHRSLSMKGLTYKPIILLNTEGFYDGFVGQVSANASRRISYTHSSLLSRLKLYTRLIHHLTLILP